VRCLTDVSSPLVGPLGAAAVFGPQKGASPDDVALLDAALGQLVRCLGGQPDLPGCGAAGGTGYGLATAWDASLVPGAATVAALIGLPEAIASADLVITGEGRFDATSLSGKAVGTVLALASAVDTPVVLIAGQLAADPPCPAVSLTDLAGSPQAAMSTPLAWLHTAATTLAP
jgi:glycerate kinase